MTAQEIAHMTGYTVRMIQYECAQGHLKATRTTRKSGWQIAHVDYVVWRSTFQNWRKPYKGRQ
jgi:hypothetical protein